MSPPHLTANNDPRVGKTLGKWTLERLLGVGGMASVYAASHRNGAVAALKVLHPEFARIPEARSRFMREAYIANKAGPGAVRVLDDDVDDDGAPYLVMELLTGEPVDERAARSGGRLSVLEVLWIASETLATLEVAHANGIIHRDLKPENLFWTVDDSLKVLDFGIARMHATGSERTVAGTVMGTLGFMAHEQALGRSAEIDARTDIWAVGAIMYHLLSGGDVHPAGEMNALVVAATRQPESLASVAPGLPAEVVRIVDRALQFEREDRYQTAAAMRQEIVRFVGADEMKASIPSLRPPPMSVRGGGNSLRPPPEEPAPGLATGMSSEDTMALRELLDLIEVAVLSRDELVARARPRWQPFLQLGSFRRLEMAYRHAVSALGAAHIGLFWNVLPEGFATSQGLLWVARPPLAPTPAQMFEGGVRMLGLLPGLELEEFREVVRLVRGDLTPFTDFATFLQSSPLPHLVHRIDPTKPGMPEHPSLSMDSTRSGQADVVAMMDALATSDPALRAALLNRLERVGEGHEVDIGSHLRTAGVDLAMGLLRVLNKLGTEASREAMLHGAESDFPIVRIEALASVDPDGERLRSELRAAVGTGGSSARVQNLVALATYKIKAAAPVVAQRIKSAELDGLPLDERRQLFATLVALQPSRAENIALGLLQDARPASAEAHDATREVACEVIGRIGTTSEAREVLSLAANGSWRASEPVRAAARAALETFEARIEACRDDS